MPSSSSAYAPRRADDLVWQRVRFYIHWEKDKEPLWHIDTLLAHDVVSPALQRERQDLVLWRFHRRANDDPVGHSLSFLTYASRELNASLCHELQTGSFVGSLIEAGVLDKVECEGFSKDKEQLVEGTSDPNWPIALQRTWPYYIMGVSEMWLRLIDEQTQRLVEQKQPRTLAETVAHYQTVNEAVTHIWQDEGEHAFLHHLNGLFGYEPIRITERKLYRF